MGEVEEPDGLVVEAVSQPVFFFWTAHSSGVMWEIVQFQ